MSKIYTYSAWEQTFKPIYSNPDNNTMQWETYGDEVEYVIQQDNHNVWTEVDGESGTYILNGYHLVNRIHYYITEKPWEDEFVEVPTWVYRDCDCVGVFDYYANTDCPDCLGEGTVEISVDTAEDLKAIYGEDAEVIG